MTDRRPTLFLRLGCGHLLGSLVLACLLLALNGIAVASLYHAWTNRLADFWRHPRVAQTILFLGPVLLLLVQWWAIDVIVDYFRPLPARARSESDRKAKV